MSSKERAGVVEIIRRLSEAKVINTDVTLQATLGAVSASITGLEDPVDFWCGTIRRPWVVVRPHIDVEDAVRELAQVIVAARQPVGSLQTNE